MPPSQVPRFVVSDAFEEWHGSPAVPTPPLSAWAHADAGHHPVDAVATPLLAEAMQLLWARRASGLPIYPEHLMPSDDTAAGGQLPHFFTDELPAPVRSIPRRLGHPPGLLEELLQAPSREMRQALVKQALRENGFEWLGYGSLQMRSGGLRALRFFASYAHEAWAAHYFAQGYHHVDVRHKDAPASGLPLVWDLESLEQAQSRQPMRPAHAENAARQRRFLNDMESYGIRSGVFLRLPTPGQPGEHTFISFLSGTPSRQWIIPRVTGNALALGLSIHEYVSQHVLAADAQASPPAASSPGSAHDGLAGLVSPTQRAILEKLVAGRSDKEIAYQLGLSSYAVDYHMRQLRRRFHVRNRVQLANAAAASLMAGRSPE